MPPELIEEINIINNNFSLIKTLSKVITSLSGDCYPELNKKEFIELIYIQQMQIEKQHKDLQELIKKLNI